MLMNCNPCWREFDVDAVKHYTLNVYGHATQFCAETASSILTSGPVHIIGQNCIDLSFIVSSFRIENCHQS